MSDKKIFTVLYEFNSEEELNAWFEKYIKTNLKIRGGNVVQYSSENVFQGKTKAEGSLETVCDALGKANKKLLDVYLKKMIGSE